MADLRPELPPGFPANMQIDTLSAAYRATLAVARENGMSQKQFAGVLGMEAARVLESKGGRAPVDQMTFAQKRIAGEVLMVAKKLAGRS